MSSKSGAYPQISDGISEGISSLDSKEQTHEDSAAFKNNNESTGK